MMAHPVEARQVSSYLKNNITVDGTRFLMLPSAAEIGSIELKFEEDMPTIQRYFCQTASIRYW